MRRFVLPLALAGTLCAVPVAFAGAETTCVFTISMTSGIDINNLDFAVNYLATGGNVEGTPNRPECVRAVGGQTFASFHDRDDTSVLSVAFIRLSYFSAPTPLAACRIFYDTTEPTPQDFSINVTNAGRDGGDGNVSPKPTLVVSKVECPGEFPSLTTTTTFPETTTTTLPGDGRCGFPLSAGTTPTASDALFVLKAAVGGGNCELCECDVNDSGSVAAGDALTILKVAVGGEAELVCPACE